jgi:hypothetical protein
LLLFVVTLLKADWENASSDVPSQQIAEDFQLCEKFIHQKDLPKLKLEYF